MAGNFPYPHAHGQGPFLPAQVNPWGLPPIPHSPVATVTQGVHAPPAPAGGFRHGSGANNSPGVPSPPSRLRSLTATGTRRDRSRDNDDDESSRPMGPRSRRDVGDVMEDGRRKLEAVERAVRNHAHALAKCEEKITAQELVLETYRNGCATMEVKLQTLEAFAQTIDNKLGDMLGKATFEFQSQDTRIKQLEARQTQMNNQFEAKIVQLSNLINNAPINNAPSNHYIGSPNSGFEAFKTVAPTDYPPGVQEAPQQPGVEQRRGPEVFNGGNTYGVRAGRAAGDGEHVPRQEHARDQEPQRQQHFDPGFGHVPNRPEPCPMFLGGVRAFQINRKNTQAVTTFSGDMGKYQNWRSRIVDHLVESHWRWAEVLEITMKNPNTDHPRVLGGYPCRIR